MAEKTNKRKQSDIVAEFEADYGEALAEARKAAETTATDGWLAIYDNGVNGNQKLRNETADLIEADAAIMRGDAVPAEGALKDLKDHVKTLVDLCDIAAMFDASTVSPLRGTVERLNEIMREYEAKAEADQRDANLIAGDVGERMTSAIAAQPKARGTLGLAR